jgi:hypothetical protein
MKKENYNIDMGKEIPKVVYFKNKKYIGEACYINGYNGYSSTEGDACLCALIENSCFTINGKPNYLLDENGCIVWATDYRGTYKVFK